MAVDVHFGDLLVGNVTFQNIGSTQGTFFLSFGISEVGGSSVSSTGLTDLILGAGQTRTDSLSIFLDPAVFLERTYDLYCYLMVLDVQADNWVFCDEVVLSSAIRIVPGIGGQILNFTFGTW